MTSSLVPFTKRGLLRELSPNMQLGCLGFGFAGHFIPAEAARLGIIVASVLTFFTATVALGDYAWIPKTHNLYGRAGFDFVSSGDNLDADGIKSPILLGATAGDFRSFNFWVEPEYGFAKDMSASIRLGFISNSVESSTASLSGSGLGDVKLAAKYMIMADKPTLTLEVNGKIPLYGIVNPAPDELVLGDGNFDLGVLLHAGYIYRKQFFFSLSPGLLFRFSGYASAFTLEPAVGATVKRFGFRLFAKWQQPFEQDRHLDSSVYVHDAPGGGGSYARLSGSPSLFSLGYRLSARVHGQKRVEATLMHSVAGSMAPSYVQFGMSVFWPFDFYKAEEKIKIREVPFDYEDYETKPEESPQQ